jgi:hypothetical protein
VNSKTARRIAQAFLQPENRPPHRRELFCNWKTTRRIGASFSATGKLPAASAQAFLQLENYPPHRRKPALSLFSRLW